MLTISKIALGPVLLAQGRRLRKTALRLPEAAGPRAGRFPGNGPGLRLLFVGDSSCAGVGVDHQRDALAQQVARRIAEQTQAPVAWQLVARSGVNTAEALELLQAHKLAPADVVVTALGVNDVTSQRGARRFIEDYTALLAHVQARTGARQAIVSGVPPLHTLPSAPQPLRWYLGQCAHRLDGALAAYCRRRTGTRFVSLQWARPDDMAIDRFHPGATGYATWAGHVAAVVTAPAWPAGATAAPPPLR